MLHDVGVSGATWSKARLRRAAGAGTEDRHVEVSLHLKPFSAAGEKRLKHGRHRVLAAMRRLTPSFG
jgi:hypothetical protein